ncbi:MAG: BspA family leucine-rich repeat surface protein [Bacilli bacterium]
MNVEKNGFTLTELLAVIAIISILTLMAVPAVIKIYNDGVIKTMRVQENEIKHAANLFIEDYCNDPLDHSLICPQSYSKPVNNKKVVCLSDLQNSKDKYISNVKYKDSDCKGYVTYYLDENTGIYGNEKTYLFCGLKEDGTYEYITDNNYDTKEYCSCNNDELCQENTDELSCTFDGELVQGAEYVNGHYTYRYMQEGNSSGWININDDGWGVQLTDKTSTDPVTSKLCTSINDKPIVSMDYMFANSATPTIDVSSFDTSNVINMEFMFYRSSASTLDLRNFDTSNVTNMGYMFEGSKATTIDLSSFDTNNVTDMSSMFNATKASTLDLSSFDTTKITDMSYMFEDSLVTTIDLSSFDTYNVKYMECMFYKCTNLKTIYVSNTFNTDSVQLSISMFGEATNLVGGAGTTYNSSYVDKTYAHIDGGTIYPGYFTLKN